MATNQTWPNSAVDAPLENNGPPEDRLQPVKQLTPPNEYATLWGANFSEPVGAFAKRCVRQYTKAGKVALIQNGASYKRRTLYQKVWWVGVQSADYPYDYLVHRHPGYAAQWPTGLYYWSAEYKEFALHTDTKYAILTDGAYQSYVTSVKPFVGPQLPSTSSGTSTNSTGSTAAGRTAVSSIFGRSMSPDTLESYYRVLATRINTAAASILSNLPDSLKRVGGSADARQYQINNYLKTELKKKGFTDSQINQFLTGGLPRPPASTPPVTSRPPSSNSRGSVDNTVPPAPTPVVTRVKIKAPFGYVEPPLTRTGRPHLYQTYPAVPGPGGRLPDIGVSEGQALTEIFYFPYIPNNVQYSGLGSTWTELPRVGDFPIVEWSNYNLLKISFEFLIAHNRTEPGGAVVPDGLFTDVEAEIDKLRRMAQRPYPVSVYGMDSMLRVAMRRAADTGRPLEFAIADLSINAIRRTADSAVSKLAAASVRLTLQEKPVEQVKVAEFRLPIIVPPATPKKRTPPPAGGGTPLIGVSVEAGRTPVNTAPTGVNSGGAGGSGTPGWP